MVNLNREDTKRFINLFAGNPAECSKVMENVDYIFFDNGIGPCSFYLYPSKQLVKSKFQIYVRNTPISNLWSVVMLENGKSNLSTYKKNISNKEMLIYVLQLLNQDGK